MWKEGSDLKNYKLVAIQAGDCLIGDTSINTISRAAHSVFGFEIEHFPCESITSQRAKLIYDWILTLQKQDMAEEEKDAQLVGFLRLITPKEKEEKIKSLLEQAGITFQNDYLKEFSLRSFHYIINKNCYQLYKNGHYFHAVFEAAKVYNKIVKEKSQNDKDGFNLMMDVLGKNGVLKITECKNETDINVQEGIKFLSAGLMQAIRNPIAHEPALDWAISREDCLDLLSFISFLLRQLDKAEHGVMS